MLSLVKLMKPATNTKSSSATIRMRCFSAKATTAFMLVDPAGSVGLGCAIDKNGTARHDFVPYGKAGENLDHAVADPSRADLAQCKDLTIPCNPDARPVPFVDDRLRRNRRRRRRLTDDDAEIREHSRLQRVVRVLHFGADRQAVSIGIHRRGDPGNLPLEDAIGIGQHMDLQWQAEMYQWRIHLTDIG